MQTIKVVAIGRMAEAFGEKMMVIPFVHGMTVQGLFTQLAPRVKPEYSQAIVDPSAGNVSEYLAVFVNSREIRTLKGPDTLLSPGDVVTILPPMAGG